MTGQLEGLVHEIEFQAMTLFLNGQSPLLPDD